MNLLSVPAIFFAENGVVIAHCVPLDVLFCGHNLEEAKRNIHVLGSRLSAYPDSPQLHPDPG